MKLLFVLVGLILFCKGIEKGSNWLFFGGLILMMSFLRWQIFDNWFFDFVVDVRGWDFCKTTFFTKLSKRGCNFSLFYSFFLANQCV